MIGQHMPASFDTARGREPTLCRAGIAAEKNGPKLATGGRFLCPRLGPMTRETCLENFQAGHPACVTGFICGLGSLIAKKEGVGMATRGTCKVCGQGPYRLYSGRCRACADGKVKTPTPPPRELKSPAVSRAQEPDDGQQVGPRVREAGEKLRSVIQPEGQLVGADAPGPLVIDGMEFEPFTPRIKPDLKPFVSLQSGKTFNFSPGAVRQFGLLRYRFVELRYSRPARAIAFIFHEEKPDGALSLFIPKAKDRGRVGAQGFMSAFGLDLKGQGPWPLKQPQPGVLVARVG